MEEQLWMIPSWWNDNTDVCSLFASPSVEIVEIRQIHVFSLQNTEIVTIEVFYRQYNEEVIKLSNSSAHFKIHYTHKNQSCNGVTHQPQLENYYFGSADFQCTKQAFLSQIKDILENTKLIIPNIVFSHSNMDHKSFWVQEELEILEENGEQDLQRYMALDKALQCLHLLSQWHSKLKNTFLDKAAWEFGGYWSLEKQSDLLEGMVEGWVATANAFGSLWGDANPAFGEVLKVGERLHKLASLLHSLLHQSDTQGADETVLQGNFQASNFIFKHNDKVELIDFEWIGPGLYSQDVVHFLYCSMDPLELFEKEEELLKWYHSSLTVELSDAGHTPLSFERFKDQYEIAFLDFMRYIVGSLWSNFTPEMATACQEDAGCSHILKDSRALYLMANKTVELLNKFQLDQYTSPAVQLVEKAVILAEAAGQIIKEIIEEGAHISSTVDKNNLLKESTPHFQSQPSCFNPQTVADVTAERHITKCFKDIFPDVEVVGEEATETGSPIGQVIEIPKSARRYGYAGLDVVSLQKKLPEEFEGANLDLSKITIWVDPLDGTKEMLLGYKENVTVLIGIAYEGSPVFGVIHQPYGGTCGKTYAGGVWAGQEAMKRDCTWKPFKQFTLDPVSSPVLIKLGCSRGAIPAEAQQLHPAEVVQAGGAGHHFVNILEQKTNAFIFPHDRTSRWDICAGHAILGALGGIVIDRLGLCDYTFGVPDIHDLKSVKNLGGVIALSNPSLLKSVPIQISHEISPAVISRKSSTPTIGESQV